MTQRPFTFLNTSSPFFFYTSLSRCLIQTRRSCLGKMFREGIQIALSTPYAFCHKREIKAAAWASALVGAASLRRGNYMVEGLNLTLVDVFLCVFFHPLLIQFVIFLHVCTHTC